MSTATAAIARAVQASGTIVKLDPAQFQQLINRVQQPLVVQSYSAGRFFGGYQYMVSYKGFAFHTRSKERIMLPGGAEVIDAKSIWAP